MSSAVESRRAIIAGELRDSSDSVFAVRARIIVPVKATLLESQDGALGLVGYWNDKTYRSLALSGLPQGPENRFPLEIQPDPEDDPSLVYSVKPRIVVVGPRDQRVYESSAPFRSERAKVGFQRYFDQLFMHQPFDFEAMWNRAGKQ